MEPREQVGKILFDVLKAKCAEMRLDVHNPEYQLDFDSALRKVEFVFVIPVSYKSIREANLDEH